jgi:hypothetical protein
MINNPYTKYLILYASKRSGLIKKIINRVEPFVGHYPEFVFVSTGRAGSKFISEFLSRIGIPTAHERFFTSTGIRKGLFYKGDSSWQAVPYIEKKSVHKNFIVLHHVRHPLDVISSSLGSNFFSGTQDSPFTRFASNNFQLIGDEMIDNVRWWVEWNLRCENISCFSFKIEEIEFCFEKILDILNTTPTKNWRKDLKQLISMKINTREKKRITINDIPECKPKIDLIRLSEKYGYYL